MKRRSAAILALLIVLAADAPFARSLFAESPIGFRQLLEVSPVALERGAERTVTVRSNPTLDGAYQAFFDKPGIVPGGMNHCGLILSAAADAPVNATLVRVVGKATIPDPEGKPQTVVRTGQVTCKLQSQGGGQGRWGIKTQLVGVVQPLDLLKVESEPAEVTLTPGGKAEIKVRIERKPEFKDAVTLAMSFNYFESVLGGQLPPGVKMSSEGKSRLNSDVAEGTIILEADAKAMPVERLPVAVLARVATSFSITTNYASNPLWLTVVPAK